METTRAQIASLEGQAAQSIHAIAILLGAPPAALNAEFTAPAPIPAAPIETTLGLPADALRRRPDVRSAERQLAAQFAQVNVARADLYPSFRLAGSIGLESLSLATLLVPGAQFWNAAPRPARGCSIAEQLRENLVVQSERQEQAARSYETAVLRALQEVEDSLTAWRRSRCVAATLPPPPMRRNRPPTFRCSFTTPVCVTSEMSSTRNARCSRCRTRWRRATQRVERSRAALQGARRRMERNDDAPGTGDVHSLTRVC